MSRSSRCSPFAPMLAALPLALAAALAGQNAHASAFQLKENSAEGLGRSFAGSAAAPGDCSVVVNNPAAMSEIKGGCFQADLTAINFSTKFHGSGEDFLGRPLTGGDGGEGGLTQPVPAIYFMHAINEQWALGAALTVPFGFQTEYDDGWVGRYEALKSKLNRSALTFSASCSMSDEFSLGAQHDRAAHQRRAHPGDRFRHDPRRSDQRRAAAAGSRRLRQPQGRRLGLRLRTSACCGSRRRTTTSASISIRRSITRSKATASSWCRRTCCRCSAARSSTAPARPTSTRRRS